VQITPDGNHTLNVSIASHIKDPITNEILIQMPKPTSQLKTDIEICLKLFHYYYDRVIISSFKFIQVLIYFK